MKTAKNVAAYIAAAPAPARASLRRLRALVRAVAPDAEEYVGYGLPGYKLHGRPFAYFGAFKGHVGFFPGSGSFLRAFARELAPYGTSKGGVRFPYGKPLPIAFIRKMLKARLASFRPASRTGALVRCVKRHNDGTVWARGTLMGGTMHGAWTWYRKDGTKMRSGAFDRGVQSGTWTTFDSRGRVVKKTVMKPRTP